MTLFKEPIALEIVKNALSTIAEEMGVTVVRSAYSTAVKEGGDATSAIFDGQGRLIAQSTGAPLMHLSSLRPSLQELLKDFPPSEMADGDIYIFNDPYRGGIHANDMMLFKPVFHDGRLAFFTTALIHVADVGGMSAGGLPANATETFHEGLLLPPVKLEESGRPYGSVLAIVAANSRTPEKVLGDIRAMVAAVNIGARRLVALAERHGLDKLLSYTNDMMDYSEQRIRQEIQSFPHGVCEGAFVIDDDGVDEGRDFRVQVAITIADSSLIADFTGTDQQARGPINASVSQSMSGVLYALRCFIDPTIPMNEGCYRPLRVVLPEGTLVNPNPPAACNARMATVMAIIEAMLQAFSRHYPEAAVAASSNVQVYTMNGVDRSTGKVWTFMDSQFGGVGARSTKDGLDITPPLIFSGGSVAHTVEALEMEYPVRFRSYRLRQDSGGPGLWRGGLGIQRDVQILEDGQLTARVTDRCRRPPPGIFGGQPGKGGRWVVNQGTPQEIELPPKVTGYPLRAGDTVTMLTAAGGGFGPPMERDPRLVLRDVLERRVSIEAARSDYGVSITPATMTVDDDETRRLRARADVDGKESVT